MSTDLYQLEDRIKQLRKELIQKVEETGLNSQDTLCCSQKLDQLIMTYQRILIKEKIEYINRGDLRVF